ncbi:MAG: protease modulator HflC, partial [Deltaproteobacteria bacterium]|nr:protease modulator HflC [Deltaproteobacteria bacterium]
KAEKIRGEGDMEAIKIYAEAIKKGEKFYNFIRSLEAYKKGLNNGKTTFVLTPDSEFLKFIELKGTK